jgi:Ca-activated chloride channel family protein
MGRRRTFGCCTRGRGSSAGTGGYCRRVLEFEEEVQWLCGRFLPFSARIRWPRSLSPIRGLTTAFRADSTLVLVPVSVTDPFQPLRARPGKGRLPSLRRRCGAEGHAFLERRRPALSIGLLVDTSGSMGAKLDTSRRAVVGVSENVEHLRRSVPGGVQRPGPTGRAVSPTTRARSKASDDLGHSGGLTALLDAVHVGLQEMKRAKNPRKALLIISDGGDNNSRFTSTQIADLVREADVQIYAMGVFEPTLSFG